MKKKNKLPGGTWFFGILAIICLLWGGYKLPQESGDAIVKNAVVIENGTTSAANDGKVVFASGKPVIKENPKDPVTGISADGYILVRDVEMYQYYIDDDTVYKDFISEQRKDIAGRGGETYTNPDFPADLSAAVICADVYIDGGNLRLGEDYLCTFNESNYKYFNYSHDLADIDNSVKIDGYTYATGWYYSGSTSDYQLGDIRIRYKYLPASSLTEISAVGLQNGTTLGGISNAEKAFMTDKTCSVQEMSEIISGNNHSVAVFLLFLALVNFVIALVIFLVKKGKLKKQAVNAVILALAVVSLSLFPLINAKADFGDYGGDYDYGGYDYGGNDYDYGGNDYDYGGYDNDYDYTTRETTTAYYYYISGSRSDDLIYGGIYSYLNNSGRELEVSPLGSVNEDVDGGSALFGTSYFGYIIGYLIYKLRRRNKPSHNKPGPRPAGAQRTNMSELLPIEDFMQIDTGFDPEKFKADVADMYVKFQHSWQNKDMRNLRGYLTDEFYAQCEGNLQNYVRNHQTNMIENIVVDNVEIRGWKHDNTNDVIVAELKTEITDYVIDDSSGNVVRGSRTNRRIMQYEWSLVRKSGIVTQDEDESEKVCPNCGAPLTLNAANECEYCGSIITMEAHNWAVSSIKGLSQRTIQN